MIFENVTKDPLKMINFFPVRLQGDEKENHWRYRGMATQNQLMSVLSKLHDDLEKINADDNFTDAGKLRRFAERGKAALVEVDGIESGSVSAAFYPIKNRLAELESKMTTTLVDSVPDVLREIETRRFILEHFSDANLIGVLNGAVEKGDAITYQAIINAPGFILDKYMLNSKILADVRRRWAEKKNPQNALEYSELYEIVQLLKYNFEMIRQDIYNTCHINDLRKYTEQERQILQSAELLRGAMELPPVHGPNITGQKMGGKNPARTDHGTRDYSVVSAQPPTTGPISGK